MSKILPYENITLETNLKSEEVYQKLSASTEPKRSGLFSQRNIFGTRTDKVFEGVIQKQSFDFRRIIYYQNSFLPNVTGSVEQLFHGSEIHIKLRMPLFATVFTCVWLGIVSIVFLAILFTSPAIPILIIPSIMLVFGIGLFIIPFKIEARKVKNILKELLEAEIRNEL